jgi:DNA-binding transcriptional MerR regulator
VEKLGGTAIAEVTPDIGLTVQAAAARTGLSEHTLRYYERAGLLRGVRRRSPGGHRRYSEEDIARLATLACLRATGMSLEQMRRYFAMAERGRSAARELRLLLEGQRDVLEERLAQMQAHQAYVLQKIAYWIAIEAGDDQEAERISCELATELRRTDGAAGSSVPAPSKQIT